MMEMTRRQFALSIAVASSLPSSLFEPTSPLGIPRCIFPGRVELPDRVARFRTPIQRKHLAR